MCTPLSDFFFIKQIVSRSKFKETPRKFFSYLYIWNSYEPALESDKNIRSRDRWCVFLHEFVNLVNLFFRSWLYFLLFGDVVSYFSSFLLVSRCYFMFCIIILYNEPVTEEVFLFNLVPSQWQFKNGLLFSLKTNMNLH